MIRRQVVILTARRDEMTGEIGLCIPGLIPSEIVNSNSEGLAVAHDLIEHQNGAAEIGGIADEMEALGALWFVRGVTGRLRRDSIGSAYSADQNLAHDLARMFDDWHSHGQHLDTSAHRTRACDADCDLDSILEWARRYIDENQNECDRHDSYTADRGLYLATARDRMRIGYRKAKKKYGSTSAANSLFWQIADAIQPYLKACEFEGQQFKLVYGGPHRAYCMEHYADDPY